MAVMPHFFEKRDPWGHGLGLWVLVFMAFTLPLAVWGVSHLRMENGVEQWLSDDNIQTRQFDWYSEHFATEDSLLLTWDDSALEDPRLEKLALRLLGTTDAAGVRRGGLKLVQSVQTPGQLIRKMVDAKIDREEAVRRVTGVLAGPGRVWCQFSTAALGPRARSLRFLKEEAFTRFGLDLKIIDSFRELSSGEEAEAEIAADAATAEAAENPAAEIAVEEAPAHDFQVAWAKMHASPKQVDEFIAWAKTLKIPVAGQRDGEPLLTECFVHAGQPAALSIALSPAGQADRTSTLKQIRSEAEAVGVPASALHLGGSPVAAAALNDEIMKAVWNPAAPWYRPHQRSVVMFSWAVGLCLTFWLLRSVRLAVIVLAASYFTTLVTVALVPAGGGTMNLALLAMPTLLLVVTMSGAVYFVNYWKNETSRDPQTAIVQAILAARIPCLMASIATAMGLMPLLTSQLQLVRDLGFYSAIGTLISAAVVLYAIPAMLQAWPAVPVPVTAAMRRPWTGLARLIVRHSTATTVVWLTLSAIAVYGLSNFWTETKVIHYFPNNSQLVQDYNYLEEQLSGIVPVETVVSFGRSAREELNFGQRMEVVRAIEQKMRALPEISGTMSLADFLPVAETQPTTTSMKEKLAFNSRAKSVEDQVRQDPQTRSLYQVSKVASEFNAAGDELWRITSQVALMSRLDYADVSQRLDEICRSETKYHADTRHLVTGRVPLFLATQQAAIEGLLYSFLLALGLIAVVMMVAVRDVLAGLMSMLPNLLPLGIVFGVMAWCDIPVDLGTLITASVALGIGVVGTLHLMTWYRKGIVAGLSHRRAIVKSLEQCGPALWQTNAAIAVAMLVLTPASLVLISRFGLLMGALVTTAMLVGIVLTPAMLAGPMGWLILRSAQKQRNRLKAVTEDPDPEGMIRHAPHVLPPKPQIAAESRPDSAQFEEPREVRQRKRRR